MSLGIATFFGFGSHGKKRLQSVQDAFKAWEGCLWHDLLTHHQTSCQTKQHGTRVDVHGFVVPAHQRCRECLVNLQHAFLRG